MGASARDGDDAGDGVRDDGDDANDEEEEEEDFVGACRVCLFDVTREDIRDARAIRLGCACVSGVVHVDAECLEAWVLRAPRKSADCEICLERMTNVPTRAELRKERRLRREKYRARTVSSSSSASARDDDARDDDARSARTWKSAPSESATSRAASGAACTRALRWRARTPSFTPFARTGRVCSPSFCSPSVLPCSLASRYCSDASLDRRGERRRRFKRGVPVETRASVHDADVARCRARRGRRT